MICTLHKRTDCPACVEVNLRACARDIRGLVYYNAPDEDIMALLKALIERHK
jgi:hypothetical protein